MGRELEDLKAKAEQLGALAGDRPEAAKARRLAARLDAGDFLVAVVGEFKRGKSTLVNALVGEAVLPTGVLPLTAVATELRFGPPSARVVYLDGRTEEIDTGRIATFATESINPQNSLGVARIELRGRWPMLEPGAVLVDTPGIASLHEHNTAAGNAALLDADGAIVVLSADAPLSEHERALLEVLRDRRSPTFFVLNKSDHLGKDDLFEVRRFLVDEIGKILHTEVDLFAVDARAALAAASAGGPEGDAQAGIEFYKFSATLAGFIADDLAAARLATARRELARLGASVSEGLAIERSVRTMASGKLQALVERFAAEAEVQRRGFEDDRTLLARDTAALRDAVGDRLADFARQAPREQMAELARASSDLARAELEEGLRQLVEAGVEAAFARERDALLSWVDDQWHQLADRFRANVQRRVDSARDAAASLFDVPLPRLEIPELAEQRDRFSFLFLHVGSVADPLNRAASRLVPERLARRRALAHAGAALVSEFDKHAGRARWDVAQRLEDARLALERAMRDELESSIAAIVEATDRARRWQAEDEEDRAREDQLTDRLERLGTSLVALGATA